VESAIVRPPYVAYAAFEALLKRAAAEPIPPRIDKALLAQWDIAAGNESAMLTSLRSLGLVGDDGTPSEDYRELRLSPPRRVLALRRAIARAYPGLGDRDELPLDPNWLRDYLVADRGLSGQMVDKATRFYRHLVEAVRVAPSLPAPSVKEPGATAPSGTGKAVVPTGEGTVLPGREGELPVAGTGRRRASRFRRAGGGQADVILTVHVDVPFGASEEELRGFFQRVRRAWADEGSSGAGRSSETLRRRRMS